MNNKVKTILLVLVIVLLLGGSYLLYQRFSNTYSGGSTETTAQETSEESAQSTAPVETTEKEYPDAPDFTFYDGDGTAVTLQQFLDAGKPIVLNFWASWCGPCKMEMPHLQKAFDTYGEDVQFLMVNLTGGGNDTQENAEGVIADNGYTFPVYFDLDNGGAYAYGIRSMPTTCFIDETGKVKVMTSGALTEDTLATYLGQITEVQ